MITKMRGFTLIETLLALAILAVLSAAAVMVLQNVIRADGLTGPAELETFKGDIRASISRTQGARIEMDGGPVSLPREHFVGRVTDDSALGDLLGGGPLVQMSTSGGKMVLVQE